MVPRSLLKAERFRLVALVPIVLNYSGGSGCQELHLKSQRLCTIVLPAKFPYMAMSWFAPPAAQSRE